MEKKIKKEDLFDLDCHLAEYILPRLVAFRKMKRTGYPADLNNKKEWDGILDEMIYGMKDVLKGDIGANKKAQKGLEELGKHFRSLWD